MKQEDKFDQEAARIVIRQIQEKPNSVIGLSTGRTTGNMHRIIAKTLKEENIDYSHATFFGIDEVTNVSPDYSGACVKMLRDELIDSLAVADENFLMLPTVSDDWDDACSCFVAELKARGGVDLLMLGIGENGHLGFNQPGSPWEKEAWVTVMYPELEERIRRETSTPAEVPLGGVTLGIKEIMHARRIVLLAKGSHKAEIVERAKNGPITLDVPASCLQLHPSVEWLTCF